MKLLLFVSLLLLTQERFLAPRCLFQVNTAFTDSLLATLPDTRLNDYYFKQLYDMNKTLLQTGRTPLQLTPEEIVLLQAIAQSQTNMAYSARSLLYLALGQEFEQALPPLPDELLSANWQMYINYKQAGQITTTETYLNILPNPAQNEAYIHLQTTDSQPQELLFYNMTGKLCHTQILAGSGVYKLNTAFWNSGIYYYRLVQNGMVKDTGKLVIAK